MSFKVAARTVLELGAELISSDTIAIYELVKNAFDAGSPNVTLSFKIVIRRSSHQRVLDGIDGGRFQSVESALKEIEGQLLFPATSAQGSVYLAALRDADSLAQLRDRLERAYIDHNFIEVADTGSGMGLDKLREAFLTIGTPSRILERQSDPGTRPKLGEKGVGRLSAMRLGSLLEVRTARAEDSSWNELDIDWDDFSRDPEMLIGDVKVDPRLGTPKVKPGERGTRLIIRNLTSDWTLDSVKQLAISEFSRLTDPFEGDRQGFPIDIDFNGAPVAVRQISTMLFETAHGYCKGRYTVDDDFYEPSNLPRFIADFTYRLYNEKQHFEFGPSELRDMVQRDVPESALTTLGDFEFEFYWFNRRLLSAVDGIGNVTAVRKLVNAWSGGLMMFRDGFRVNPYGNPGDDWLDLNTQAFKSSGYLLNTDQIIGRVRISHADNPRLLDQTNREGLRDNFEKTAMVRILHHFLTVSLKRWMDQVNDEYRGLKAIDLQDLERNVEATEKKALTNLKSLRQRFPGQDELLERLQASLEAMALAFKRAKGVADKAEKDQQRLVDLAGIGLMVEVVSHELARAAKHTLEVLKDSRRHELPADVRSLMSSLNSQMVTIEKRLRVLDPLSVSGRQRKSEFDLVSAITVSFESRSDLLREQGITWSVRRIDGQGPVWVKAVQGMVAQIAENLLSNSIHWLMREKGDDATFRPVIEVEVSAQEGGSFTWMDNGPGIAPQAAERVFDAFYTTRGEGGRGVGLYISRENALYHGGELRLLTDRRVHPDRLNFFHFALKTR